MVRSLPSPLPDVADLRRAEAVVRSRIRVSARPTPIAPEAFELLAERLDHMTYRPRPYYAVGIAKPSGETRWLALPCYPDRIVARALLDRLAAKAEPLRSDWAHAYRPGRGVGTAITQVERWRRSGLRWGLHLDIHDCFGCCTFARWMGALHQIGASFAEREIVRRLVCAPTMNRNGVVVTRGLPQGLCLSPLLADLVLAPLDRSLTTSGYVHARYGDDFLVGLSCAGDAPAAEAHVRDWLASRGMRLACEKTRLFRLTRESRWLGRPVVAARSIRPPSFVIL